MIMTRTTNIKNFLKIGLLLGLFTFIIGYSIFQTKAITKGVNLTLSGIKDGQSFDSNVLTLVGQALHAKHISINDREILVDQENNFTEEIVLSPGYNIITIEAEDKFDKKVKNTYHVYYKEEANVAMTTLNN
jgi:hypothetical protein